MALGLGRMSISIAGGMVEMFAAVRRGLQRFADRNRSVVLEAQDNQMEEALGKSVNEDRL